MYMGEISWNDILKAAAAIAAVCGFIAALWKGVEAIHKLARTDERAAHEQAQNAAIADLTARVGKCEERLEKGDQQFVNSREDMTKTLTVLNAMLMHFNSGNDHEKLKDVKNDLDSYLMHR
jgi:hypothetical protein